MRISAPFMSAADFLIDKGSQCAECLEGVCADFVVIDAKAEVFFHGGQDGDDGHGVEFGHCAKQGRVGGQAVGTGAELQGLGQQCFDGLLCVHWFLLEGLQN